MAEELIVLSPQRRKRPLKPFVDKRRRENAPPGSPVARRIAAQKNPDAPLEYDASFAKLTDKQKEAVAFLAGPQRHSGLVGGSRAGKTVLFVWTMFVRRLRYAGTRGAIFRFRANSVWPSIGLQTIPFVHKTFFPQVDLKTNASLHYFTFPNESEIWLGGLDTVAVAGKSSGGAAEKVLGQEFFDIFLNECSQIPYSSALLALTRLAQTSTDPAGIQRAYYDLNPVGKGHWTNQLLGEKRDPVTKQPLEDPEEYGRFFINPEDNKENLSAAYIKSLQRMPPKQRMRFYSGIYVDETENALWSLEQLERCRVTKEEMPDLVRVVVAVDPSGAGDTLDQTHDAIGIVVAGLGKDGHGYVLADRTLLAGPNEWGRVAVQAYHEFKADRIYGEKNFGGAMVQFVINTIDKSVPFEEVNASRGKVLRAEPVASLYGDPSDPSIECRVHHVGPLPDLEDEMSQFTDMGYVGERSPNRADAAIHALTVLMLGESVQGWIDFYAKMADGQTKTGAASIIAEKPRDPTKLRAPRPYMNFATSRGKYVSGLDGIIEGVHPLDVDALVNAGCVRV